MKRVTKMLLGVLTGVMLMSMTVCAQEYSVTDTDAVLWSNGNTVVQVDASAEAAVALPPMEMGTPVHITGVTSNGYWRVEIDEATYYIVGAGLGDTIVTNESIRKYYDRTIISDSKGVVMEVDYTEWNLLTNTLKIAYTATNNTPFVIDVETKDRIYDGYTSETSTTNAKPSDKLADVGEEELMITALAPGATMSGYEFYHLKDTFMEKNITAVLTMRFHIKKNETVYGKNSDYIQYKDTHFYDFTTTATRLESVNEEHHRSAGFEY